MDFFVIFFFKEKIIKKIVNFCQIIIIKKNYQKWSFFAKKLSFFDKITKNGQFLSKNNTKTFVKNLSFLFNFMDFYKKLQKIVNFCQKKIIQKLVFWSQFNAFLKKKLQKWSFLSKNCLFCSISWIFLKEKLPKIVFFEDNCAHSMTTRVNFWVRSSFFWLRCLHSSNSKSQISNFLSTNGNFFC